MTVKELHELTAETTDIYLQWGGKQAALDRINLLDIFAYGDFIVDKISTDEKDGAIIARLQVQPIKKG